MQKLVFHAVNEPVSLVNFSAEVDILLVLKAQRLNFVGKALMPLGDATAMTHNHALKILPLRTVRHVEAHGDFANDGNLFNEDLLCAHILIFN